MTNLTAPARSRKTARAAAAALLAVAAAGHAVRAQPDLAAVAEHVVVVRAFDRVEMALGDIAGFAAGGGLVVTNAQMLRGGPRRSWSSCPGGAREFPAAVRSLDERSGVAVLETEGLDAEGTVFAVNDPGEDPEAGGHRLRSAVRRGRRP